MAAGAFIDLGPDSILFADDDMVAVDKAPGVLCDASLDPDRDHLGAALERWAHESWPRANDFDDGPAFRAAHRLDLGTSGVVLFARNRAAATGLMHQFQERAVAKHYQAVVQLPSEAEWSVGEILDRRSYLRHRKGQSEEVRSGGKSAESHFEILDVCGPLALVRASPKTGRTHQLRVHLAALNAPILGDDRYGDQYLARQPYGALQRLWLHADTLELTHPVSGQALDLRSRHALVLDGPVPKQVDRPIS